MAKSPLVKSKIRRRTVLANHLTTWPKQIARIAIGFKPCKTAKSFTHLAARDAELVEQFQFSPELRTGDFAAQKLAVFRNCLRDYIRRFVQKLHAEMSHPERQQPLHEFRAGLRLRIEHGVAAARIGL